MNYYCSHCGRPLRDIRSIRIGYGPQCAKQLGISTVIFRGSKTTKGIKKRRDIRKSICSDELKCRQETKENMKDKEYLKGILFSPLCYEHCCACCPDADSSPCDAEKVRREYNEKHKQIELFE